MLKWNCNEVNTLIHMVLGFHGYRLSPLKGIVIVLFIYLFIWPHWVFVVAHGLSLVVVSGGYSSLQCAGFSLQWLLLLRSMGSRRAGFSSCGTQAQ